MPTFTFTILQSVKDCLSRQVAETIKSITPRNKILYTKKGYNSNYILRVVVEEDAFERKRKARQEEMEEVMEKRKWEKFKAEHRNKSRRKPKDDDNLPNGWGKKPKKLRRVESDLKEW